MVKTVTPVSANTAAAIVARFILVKIKMIILVPIENIKFSLIILDVSEILRIKFKFFALFNLKRRLSRFKFKIKGSKLDLTST